MTPHRKLKILFLCTGNSCRSQMAEGWARHLKGDRIEPYSAGTETHGLNPRAVRVMAEAGAAWEILLSPTSPLFHLPPTELRGMMMG